MKKQEPRIEKGMLSLRETSEYMGLSYHKTWELSHENGFPCVVIGNRRIVPKKLLDEWIEKKVVETHKEVVE